MQTDLFDVVIIGGGIVGTATGMALANRHNIKVAVIESEKSLAAHQTGHNSGVIHSGLYYKPNSLKAINCVEGRTKLYNFCRENSIKVEQCGKLVVVSNESEIPRLNELENRGKLNGLKGLRRLSEKELKEYEPHVTGIGGLFVPETGIVDYSEVTNKFAQKIEENGGKILLGCRFLGLKKKSNLSINTSIGEIQSKYLVNCAGLYSDRVAKLCNIKPTLKIIPFRGEYYKLIKGKEGLVKNLIYPVPDPKFPFLGVHFTRMINGGCEAGPNAVLAFKREGYSKTAISATDCLEMFFYPGFWKMALKFYKMGIDEYYRSFSKTKFVESLQKLIPEIEANDIIRGGAGVRAQALTNDGKLLDDFSIQEDENSVHVLNAPSPAATASISIGEKIADYLLKKMN